MENQEFTVEKSNVECYKIRHPKTGMYWADITIDVTSEKSGRISISSDYGNYANFWGSCGCEFKKFLTQIDQYYAANKFKANDWFDVYSTILRYKSDVLFSRKEGYIKAERARDIFNEIKELEGCNCDSEFVSKMWSNDELMRFYDGCPEMVKTTTPDFREFWKTVWPVFTDLLKQEIETT